MSITSFLQDLADSDSEISASRLLSLSALSKEEARELQESWYNIGAERRAKILGMMIDVAMDNPEVDFETVFRIALDDTEDAMRIKAIDGLWECNEPWLMRRLLRMLVEDEIDDVRASAASALEKYVLLAEFDELRAEDVTRLQETLFALVDTEDEPVEVRRRALESLGPLSHPFVDNAIRKAYNSDDIRFKASALYAMGRHGDEGWLPAILAELRSSESMLRYQAAQACGEMEDARAVPHLIALIDDDDPEVTGAAIEALGFIGGEEATIALRRCLSSSDEHTREAATEALANISFMENPLFS